MLASIHPLGERARGQKFRLTVTAYVVASVLGAGALGAALGALGGLTFGDDSFGDGGSQGRMVALGAAALVAAGFEAAGRRPPSWHRQVNEDWLTEYRGWVYGLGFGFQLGLGVITIVTTAAVYLVWLGAFLEADPAFGAALGAAFGGSRALPVLMGWSIRTPESLRDRVQHVHVWAGRFRTMTALVEVAAAAAVIVLVVG